MFLFGKKKAETGVGSQSKADVPAAPKGSADAHVETEEEKAARKAAEKEAAIAAYHEKRDLTLAKFFEIAGLEFPPQFAELADHPVSDFTADPRRLTADSIFMYWQVGPLSSGAAEDALNLAIKAKPLLIITNEPCDYPNSLLITDIAESGLSVITEAYIRASHYIRSIHRAKVIGLTGSVGKTSTKEMIEAVIRQHYKKPLVSKGNNNSIFSVTRNIQNLKRPTNVYLQEVGAFSPRIVEISARQLEANIAVYTNIGVSHLDMYKTREALELDKTSLSTYGKPDGVAIIKYDDDILRNHKFTQKVISYSLKNPEATYYAKDIDKTDAMAIRFTIVDTVLGEEYPAAVYAPGEHNVLNAVCAYAVGRVLKLKTEEIIAGIASYSPVGIRQNIIKADGYTIFADCYNSSLIAIDNTLAAMDDIVLPEGGRKIAVLGDILALGDISEETHRQIADVILNHNVDIVLGYGINIELTIEGLQKANNSESDGAASSGAVHAEASRPAPVAKFFADRSELEAEILRIRRPEDLILFKASHGVNIGTSIDRLFGTDINESSSIANKQYRLEIHGDWEYYIFETSASIKTYLGTDAIVEVPAYIEAEVKDELREISQVKTLTVEKLGKTSFRGNQYIKEVTVPEGIVRLRDGAFKGSSLEKITLPDSLLSIGDEAFADCPNLKTVSLSKTTLDIGKKVLENSPLAVLQYR